MQAKFGNYSQGALAVTLGMLAALLLPLSWAMAGEPAASGPDVLPPRLEARYQHLTSELRCPVCQNEPIATSQTAISKALRDIVRQKLLAGESNRQIKQYMISRYGLFAIYKPPLEGGTFLLWFGPLILFAIAAAIAVLAIRRRRRALIDPESTP